VSIITKVESSIGVYSAGFLWVHMFPPPINVTATI